MIREWNEESLDHRNTLLYAMGISEEDAKRPIIGLVNTWNEMNPGHYPFDKALIAEMKEEIYKLGGLALELPISGICDGICSNTPGDRYTLPARDLVSSEVEMVANLNMLEGMVIMATCDKVVPGMLMGAVRVDIPTVMFTGGYMAAGHRSDGRMITLTHTKQAYAAYPSPARSTRTLCATPAPPPAPAPSWALHRPCAPWRKFWALPRTTTPAPAASPKNGTSWRGRLPGRLCTPGSMRFAPATS